MTTFRVHVATMTTQQAWALYTQGGGYLQPPATSVFSYEADRAVMVDGRLELRVKTEQTDKFGDYTEEVVACFAKGSWLYYERTGARSE